MKISSLRIRLNKFGTGGIDHRKLKKMNNLVNYKENSKNHLSINKLSIHKLASLLIFKKSFRYNEYRRKHKSNLYYSRIR